jgi:nitroreductase
MDAVEAILTRRSVRKYTTRDIPDALVEQLLRAAMAAPSACNQQPWQFVIIRERSLLDEIPRIHAFSQMLKESPVAVLVCGDENLATHKKYWVQDCSAATQNLLLAAHANGLGGVWLGVYPDAERVDGLRKLLALPAHVHPFSLVALGYPAEPLPKVDRFNPERIHHNHW